MNLTQTLDSSDGYIIGHSPAVLVTRGMGPCAGLAVYDARNRMGVLGHFAIPDEENSQNFAEMMEWISINLKPGSLEVTLAGISLGTPATNSDRAMMDGLNKYRLHRRQRLYLAFRKLGVKEERIVQKFSEPDRIADISLDISTGKVEIQQEDVRRILNYAKLES